MVCEKCEKKLSKVIVPDKWKEGARNTTEGSGRKINENKLLSKKNRWAPYGQTKCIICKQQVHQEGKYCHTCAYSKDDIPPFISADNGLNYTSNSVYCSNLNTLLSSLPANINSSGFHSASLVQNPDRANALVLCRGDVNLETCRNCAKEAALQLLASCPNHEQGLIWYELCMLRQSNVSIFGIPSKSPSVWVQESVVVLNPEQFMLDLRTLVNELVPEAADGGGLWKVAAGNTTSYATTSIFVLEQCTPDLSADDCTSCLNVLAEYLPRCCYNEDLPLINETRKCWSQRWPLALSLFCLTNLLASAAPQLSCINNGNYTSNGTYKANLETLLSSLPANVDINGFYNASMGQRPDTAYAEVLCRGDIQLEECRTCIRDSLAELVKTCENYKQAALWTELCMLRYSNESMFGISKTFPSWYWWDTMNTFIPYQYMADARRLLENLRGQAARGGSLRKVAAGNRSSVDFHILFSLVQCTPDLSPEECTSCLIEAALYIPRFCNNTIRCRAVSLSCNFRYEEVPFYNETRLQELQNLITLPPQPPPPPPSPPHRPPLPPPGLPEQPAPLGKNDPNTRTAIIVSVSVGLSLIIVAVVASILLIRRTKKKPKELETARDINVAESLQYDFSGIRAATDDFSVANKLGQGGFGIIYKGTLANGQDVAVKRLSRNSGQGEGEFKNEVLLVARLQHRNLVRLLGFSMEGKERLLVYEFVKNRSLDQFIFDPIKHIDLDWESRYKIIFGISKGLLYLHEESRLKIIHRDLKASNILLDEDMNPKIADFGMARLFAVDETQANTNKIVGTYGYMAPEYAMYGQFSVKSDVFSFGVLILEIISGQQNRSFQNGEDMEDLLSLAWKHWRQGKAADIIDPVLLRVGQSTQHENLRCIHIGLLCVQDNPGDRPTMASVVVMLSSSIKSLPVPFEPTYSRTHGYNSKIPSSREFESSGSSAFRRSRESGEYLRTDMSMTARFYPR
ncbi:hypothetical protein F511_15076 [Dorcoceras hygrometricum]|uniref:Uncharacterized protein n=1 Tax=Dorcoceras hygrometricum TaxID=472368 RepID=A0A2Z7BSB6_9LAMI|nr:hypothetical protein F511_15076 [Dorcoceras hygrometricum]